MEEDNSLYEEGYDNGYQDGYSEGYEDGEKSLIKIKEWFAMRGHQDIDIDEILNYLNRMRNN